MHIYKLLMYVSALSVQLSVLAASDHLHDLSRDRAVSIALSNNKPLAAARASIAVAQARLSKTGLRANPEVLLAYSTDWMFNNEGESNLKLGFAQKFPITNRLRLMKDIAGIEIEVAKQEIRNQERMLASEVESAFMRIAYIEAQAELRKDLISLNREFADFIDSRIKSAEASSMDANRLKMELYVIEQELHEFEHQHDEYTTELRRLLGADAGTVLVIAHDLKWSATPPELPTFHESSVLQHPDYQLKELLYQIARTRSSLALANRREDISVALSFEDEHSVDEPIGIGNDRFLGLSVSIPIPVGNRNQAAIQESLAYMNQTSLELKAVSHQIRLTAESHRQHALSFYRESKHYLENVTPLVEQNLEEMNAAYAEGLISLAELFQSQEQRLKIQSTHLSMIHDFEQALVDWRATTATNLEKQGTIDERLASANL